MTRLHNAVPTKGMHLLVDGSPDAGLSGHRHVSLTKQLSDFLGRESNLRSSDHGFDALTIRPSKMHFRIYRVKPSSSPMERNVPSALRTRARNADRPFSPLSLQSGVPRKSIISAKYVRASGRRTDSLFPLSPFRDRSERVSPTYMSGCERPRRLPLQI